MNVENFIDTAVVWRCEHRNIYARLRSNCTTVCKNSFGVVINIVSRLLSSPEPSELAAKEPDRNSEEGSTSVVQSSPINKMADTRATTNSAVTSGASDIHTSRDN